MLQASWAIMKAMKKMGKICSRRDLFWFLEPQECNQPSYMYKASWCFNARGNKFFYPSNLTVFIVRRAKQHFLRMALQCDRLLPSSLLQLQTLRRGWEIWALIVSITTNEMWKSVETWFAVLEIPVFGGGDHSVYHKSPAHPEDEELNEPEGGAMRIDLSSELLKNIIVNMILDSFDSAQKPTPLMWWGKMLLIQHSIEAIQHNVTKQMHAQSTRLLIVPCLQKKSVQSVQAHCNMVANRVMTHEYNLLFWSNCWERGLPESVEADGYAQVWKMPVWLFDWEKIKDARCGKFETTPG